MLFVRKTQTCEAISEIFFTWSWLTSWWRSWYSGSGVLLIRFALAEPASENEDERSRTNFESCAELFFDLFMQRFFF